MRKFSQLDLIHNAIVTGTGEVFQKLFESKYVKLDITIPKYELLRGKALVSDVNEILSAHGQSPITIDDLFTLLYMDFLHQIKSGTDLAAFGELLLRKKKEQEEDSYKVKDVIQRNPFQFELQDKIIKNKKSLIVYPIKITRKAAWRGEVLLYDISQVVPDLNISLEELISIRYQDVMKSVKKGNVDVLRAIIANVQNERD